MRERERERERENKDDGKTSLCLGDTSHPATKTRKADKPEINTSILGINVDLVLVSHTKAFFAAIAVLEHKCRFKHTTNNRRKKETGKRVGKRCGATKGDRRVWLSKLLVSLLAKAAWRRDGPRACMHRSPI